ncbi:MAG: hypothetical protein LBS19_13230 [Clostridiales bacterium]|jgi:hypothetical protein|nr:hypothetical protein [Clostridiales bacterium]
MRLILTYRRLAAALICAFLLSACVTRADIDYTPYDDIPGDYSLEDAKRDGCVVQEDGKITAGQAVWDAFLANTEENKPATVRLVFYYTLDDLNVSEEYYEENKDNYPKMYIEDLVYDGESYTVSLTDESGDYVRTYKYLRHFTGDMRAGARYDRYSYYVLVDDLEVTWERIEYGMLSSRLGDGIDHHRVYSHYE